MQSKQTPIETILIRGVTFVEPMKIVFDLNPLAILTKIIAKDNSVITGYR